MKLDPNADGNQWIYKGCYIIKQDHPELLKYACYRIDDEFIGVSSSKKHCKIIINKYLSESK